MVVQNTFKFAFDSRDPRLREVIVGLLYWFYKSPEYELELVPAEMVMSYIHQVTNGSAV